MSNNNKTLADVQPGGMVRLGDQRSDLVPGIVRCAKCSFQLHRTNLYLQSGAVGAGDSKTEPCPNGCGPLWPVTWETWAREGWAEAERLHLENAALSAQPSPGGQGDAPLRVFSAGRWTYDGTGQSFSHEDMDAAAFVVYRDAAVAARQPVGAQRAALWVQFAENGNIRFWTRDQDRALEESFLHARPLTAFYASPQQPAQAVDLSMLIAKIDQALGYLSTALDDLDSSPDRRPSVMVDEAMGCLRQALTGVPNG